MEVPTDFAKQVEALSSSTPREAIANLLSALMPRVQATTRAPIHPMVKYKQERYADDSPPQKQAESPFAPDPMQKLTRTRSVRKPLPRGKLIYIRRNPKKVGSASWRRYNHYQEGMTASQAIAAGLTAADIQWDLDHGFIKFNEE